MQTVFANMSSRWGNGCLLTPLEFVVWKVTPDLVMTNVLNVYISMTSNKN